MQKKRSWLASRLHYLLCQFPKLYGFLARIMGKANYEKVAYLHFIKTGMLVLDIGANQGNYTVLFSNLSGRKGKVFAFEPHPGNLIDLKEKLSRECLHRNWAIEAFALSNKIGKSNLLGPEGDGGQASLAEQQEGNWSRTESREIHSVNVNTLDAWVNASGLDKIDFIKCDVEGAELWVLQGAKACIQKFKPVFALEISQTWTQAFGYKLSDLCHYLSELGYIHFWIADEKRFYPLSSADFRSLGQREFFCETLICSF